MTPVISRRFKLALASGSVVGVALAAGFAPAVRYEARQAATRYGAAVVIAGVAPTSHGVRLRGVDVTLADVPSARVHFDEVEVTYDAGQRHVALRGGTVAVVGARDVVLHQVETWRAGHLTSEATPEGASGQQGGGSGTELAGLRVSWADSVDNPTEAVVASDLGLVRADGRIVLSAGEATVSVGHTSFSVKKGELAVVRHEGGYRVAALTAAGIDAQISLPAGKPAAMPDSPAVNLDPAPAPVPPPPAPVPAPSRRRGKGARNASRSGVRDAGAVPQAPGAAAAARVDTALTHAAADDSPGLGSAYRAALLNAAHAVDLALEPTATVRLEGVRARIRRGEEVLNLGPGVLLVARVAGRLVVDLSPELRAASASATAEAHEEALTFRLAVPLGSAPGELAVDVNGGPIWLSSLGVKEGDFGLFDVGRASISTRSHLALDADGRTLHVDGEAKVHTLSIKSAALSDEPVAGLELAVRLKGEVDLDGSRARIAEGEVDLGSIRVTVSGELDRSGDSRHVRGSFDLPLTACQAMLDSTPKGLVPKLQGMRLAGSYALRGRADVDTGHLERGFVLDWDASNTCRILEAPADVSVERFRKPFQRTAYDAQSRPFLLEAGPGTASWVPLPAISKFMETAVLTTEDGGFHRHHGFDHEAIRNSIRENLRQKKFVRGASTISMQLAKNLYLDRGKNLSRKLQEAVLTMYLEQELTKEQILELYFNVVEFGPMTYGIGPAAQTYFNGSARDLSLGQALYVASIMPNPKLQHFGAGGAVTPAWMSYLRKLMKYAHARDRITAEELDEGLRETVVRGSPAPQRAAAPMTDTDQEILPEVPEEWGQ
jgi:Transglycosylase